MEEIKLEKRNKMRLEIVSNVQTELATMPDDEIIAKFFAYVRGALRTFVDHPIGEEKPSYLTAVDYVLLVASSSKIDDKQKEIFKNKWIKFKEHISEFARVDENLLEEKHLLILSELEKEKVPGCEEIVSAIRETLPSTCGDIWKQTQDYEDILSDRQWNSACSMSESTGLSPWLFLE
ncbi:MAG: hypothetical protein WC603_02630 [Candidatus Paceibacterota bacterium]